MRAGNGTRTRDPNLGKVVLYQLSYSRVPSANLTAQWGSLYRPRTAPYRPRAALAARPVEARGIEPLTS